MALSSRFIALAGSMAAALLYSVAASALTGSSASPPTSQPSPAAEPSSAFADAGATESSSKGLQPDQIYAVLVGEIAGRRGDLPTAFTYYFKAAELTGSAQMAELAVRAAISGEDDTAAGRAIRLWLDLEPDSPSAHQVAAFLRINAKDDEGALIHLQRLVELSREEGVESAFTKAAAIVMRLPSPDQQVAMMQALVSHYPGDADAQQSLAMVAASASKLDLADQAARKAMALRPEWNAPRLFLVRLLVSEDKREEARALLEGFVAASPDDHALRMLYGQFLVEEQDFTTARDVFERMLANKPKEPDVLFAVGILSLQLDDLEGARLYFERLFETGERKDEAAFYLGQTAERAHDASSALSWYAKVRGTNADDAQVRIAVLKAKAGEVAQAREILQRLREESPENAIPLFLVEAEVLGEADRGDEALDVYDAALGLHPDDTNLLYARGLYAIQHDRLEQGERDLRRIIEIDPNNADALNALGYTLADRTKRYQEARELIERAYAIKPDEPAILDSMGWVHYRLGDLKQARDYLEKASKQLDDGEVAAHLGEVLWALGRRSEAWAVWDKASKDHPDHAYLQEVIGRYRVSKTESSATPAVNPSKGHRHK